MSTPTVTPPSTDLDRQLLESLTFALPCDVLVKRRSVRLPSPTWRPALLAQGYRVCEEPAAYTLTAGPCPCGSAALAWLVCEGHTQLAAQKSLVCLACDRQVGFELQPV